MLKKFGCTDSVNSAERLTIAHLNVWSLLPKIDEVRNILSQYRYDIFAISESWLHDCILDSEIEIRGYNITEEIDLILNEGVSVYVWKIVMTLAFVLNWCLKCWDIMGQNEPQ